MRNISILSDMTEADIRFHLGAYGAISDNKVQTFIKEARDNETAKMGDVALIQTSNDKYMLIAWNDRK